MLSVVLRCPFYLASMVVTGMAGSVNVITGTSARRPWHNIYNCRIRKAALCDGGQLNFKKASRQLQNMQRFCPMNKQQWQQVSSKLLTFIKESFGGTSPQLSEADSKAVALRVARRKANVEMIMCAEALATAPQPESGLSQTPPRQGARTSATMAP